MNISQSQIDAVNAAVRLFNAGRHDEAETACRALAAALSVAAAPVLCRILALCAERKGDLPAAARFFAQIPGAEDDLFRILCDLGATRLGAMRIDEAAAALQMAAAVRPGDFNALNNLGSALRRDGRRDGVGRDAFHAYQRAIIADPTAVERHGHLKMVALRQRLLKFFGGRVPSGPFVGMAYDGSCCEGWYLPRILGCYEQELHADIEKLAQRPYDCVLNIGCAEGFYAVGLALRLPSAVVHARDVNPYAQEACRRLAAANGVAERVTIGGLFQGADFANFADKRTLLVCDIEGAEEALLDPVAYPALAAMDVLVELHDCYRPGLSEKIQAHFAATHDLRIIPNADSRDLSPVLLNAGLTTPEWRLALNEFRAGPTPWAVMTVRNS